MIEPARSAWSAVFRIASRSSSSAAPFVSRSRSATLLYVRIAESGCVSFLLRPLPDGLEARLQLDPGLRVGDFDRLEAQHLHGLALHARGADWNAPTVPFGRLGSIAASELLRDLDLLASAAE